jgi:hypothetical protein
MMFFVSSWCGVTSGRTGYQLELQQMASLIRIYYTAGPYLHLNVSFIRGSGFCF